MTDLRAAAFGGGSLAAGALVGGRYQIVTFVARGGMGEVYRAWDTQLNRVVAIKIVIKGMGTEESRARLIREATATAQLKHPNVIVIHDIGTHEDQVFIAMEFVEGRDLNHWFQSNPTLKDGRTKPHPWREVLRLMIAAGRGLAAAHKAGIIHRDFKPANVMRDQPGEIVRLMDFGIARPANVSSEAEAIARWTLSRALATAASEDGEQTRKLSSSSDGADRAAVPFDGELSQSNSLKGTLAYMSPEQYEGRVGNETTDQFSFCASLYQLLYGTLPFARGKTLVETMKIAARCVVLPRPADSDVPDWVHRIVLRGLSSAANQRFPSMDELLGALENDPIVARRKKLGRLAVASGATAMVVLGALFIQTKADQRASLRDHCRGAASKLAGIWEPDAPVSARKSRIRAAFRAIGSGFAERTFDIASRALDRYARGWTAMHVDACEATSVRNEQSPEVLDLRMSCLQGRLDAVKALGDVFQEANAQVVENATTAVGSLPPLEDCADIRLLRARVRPPNDPAVRRKVDELRPRLAEVKALADAGRVAEALARARPLADETRRLGYRPLTAQALLRLGVLSFGQPDQAEALLADAIWAAEAGGDDELFIEASVAQVYVVGYLEGQPQRARAWSRIADADLQRIGGHDILRSWLLTHEAALFVVEGRYAEAVEASRSSLALKEKALGPDDLDIAQGLGNLAETLGKLGRLEEALEVNQRALRIYEKGVGSEHPEYAMYLSARGEYLNGLGLFAQAETAARRALAIWTHSLDPEHAFLGFALTVLGRSYLGRDRPEEALPSLERALAIREQADREPSRFGETAFALAQALWQSDRDPGRALILADDARRAYAKTPEKGALSAVDGWLDAHRPSGFGARPEARGRELTAKR